MTILFLHGWQSIPGGVKPTYLKGHGHTVINPALDDDDFDAALLIAQEEFDKRQPHFVVGSCRWWQRRRKAKPRRTTRGSARPIPKRGS